MKTRTVIPVEERFRRRVEKSEGCRLWTGATTHGGYGVLQRGGGGGGLVRAHRLAYELTYGPFSPDLDVCHRCDNPACVRPDHLFLGTAKDNVADMMRKGRQSMGQRHRGERHPFAKLTDEQVRAMRREYAAGGTSHGKLSSKYGVSERAVLNILHRKTWIHVD